MGLPFTVFTIVFITNAINLIDGIDGLASGLSGIALLFFTILFIYQREWLYAALAIVTLGTIIPFYLRPQPDLIPCRSLHTKPHDVLQNFPRTNGSA